jgi:hypothetical protein
MEEGAMAHHSYGSYAPSTYGSYEPRRANPTTAGMAETPLGRRYGARGGYTGTRPKCGTSYLVRVG